MRYDLNRVQSPIIEQGFIETSASTHDSPGTSSLQHDVVSLRSDTIAGASDDSYDADQVPELVLAPASEHVQVELNVSQSDFSKICGCVCHVPLAIKTPSWVGNAVGMLLVRWYTNPQECAYCRRRKCDTVQKDTISARYFFPMWMVSRFIELESAWTSSKRLSLSLRTSRVIPDDSHIFTYTQHNNLEGVKRLFRQGLASPFDISTKGRTPLHVSGPSHANCTS